MLVMSKTLLINYAYMCVQNLENIILKPNNKTSTLVENSLTELFQSNLSLLLEKTNTKKCKTLYETKIGR